jgi:solute carrier family 45 protein 1/2/4
MSLVFMAGPLSGLIVQPLIGAFADRSQSRYGRRRPFMLAGVAICICAMMLLGWAREVSGLFGGSNWMSVVAAVMGIYLIDFSINAVMSTDRALVVDTLAPREQEDGSAWAGRMFGLGSLSGFFVCVNLGHVAPSFSDLNRGNLDLPPYLPFLGKTQLQILAFITSLILLFCHIFTSCATTERVLLRDERPNSKNGVFASIKAIWRNIFALPPGIKMICIIDLCAL